MHRTTYLCAVQGRNCFSVLVAIHALQRRKWGSSEKCVLGPCAGSSCVEAGYILEHPSLSSEGMQDVLERVSCMAVLCPVSLYLEHGCAFHREAMAMSLVEDSRCSQKEIGF